ncbi:MAG: G5 domain-containing protein [Mycoplasmatales bacterium]
MQSFKMKKHKIAFVILFLVVIALICTNAFKAKQITVYLNGEQKTIKTNTPFTAYAIKEYARENELTDYRVKSDAGLLINGNDEYIKIDTKKAVPVKFAEKEQVIETYGNTYEELTLENPQRFTVDNGEKLEVKNTPITEKIENNKPIQFVAVKEEALTEKETKDLVLETKENSEMTEGEEKVIQEGTAEVVENVYNSIYEDGKLIRKELVNSKVIAEAQPRIVEIGTKPKEPEVPAYVNTGGSREEWMLAAGISPVDFQYVSYIVERESGWNPQAQNPSGAFGLCQTMPLHNADLSTPVKQLQWCNGYAVGRYGSWQAAYNFWTTNHWW